ncbi:hypothetical protein CALVIDRAFT_568225 [Calocera viscosa TUFC12733]|uniref:ABC transmembrane type-1 domain-containing protein n=1 Tax=Calocera viscosa (strain TUFC12733) TaxID=1330018 RepID=A0A167HAJ7_CALVF|nr:hypothetical protein CALVIDRAFT_568225 [Calocera viscosa TUFC12733]
MGSICTEVTKLVDLTLPKLLAAFKAKPKVGTALVATVVTLLGMHAALFGLIAGSARPVIRNAHPVNEKASVVAAPCISIPGAIINCCYISTPAEEDISSIRTTKVFGTQHILSALCDKPIATAQNADVKQAVTLHGISLSCCFFIICSAYALTYYYGTMLALFGTGSSIGIIINIVLAIFIGSFSLAMITSEMQTVPHTLGGASKLLATIDSVLLIDSEVPHPDGR